MSKQLPLNLSHYNQIIHVKGLNRSSLQGASKYQKQITGKNWLLMWSLRGQTALLVIQTHESSRMHPGYTKEAGKPQTIFFLVSFQRDNLLHTPTPTPYSQKGQIFHFSSTAGSTFLTLPSDFFWGTPSFLSHPVVPRSPLFVARSFLSLIRVEAKVRTCVRKFPGHEPRFSWLQFFFSLSDFFG